MGTDGEAAVGPAPTRRRGRDPGEEFERFFDSVWPRCQLTARRMGLSTGESQEVALDALSIAYDRWSRVRKLPYRDAWTLKVTANLALRQLKRRHRAAGLPAEPIQPADPNMASRLELRDTLSRLPRRQREVIFLRYLADLPEAEVAAVLGIDVGSVKQHASRGRQALKHDLTLLDGGGGSAE